MNCLRPWLSRPASRGGFRARVKIERIKIGTGGILVGEATYTLAALGIPREPMADGGRLSFVRRAFGGGHYYFISNQGGQAYENWIPLEYGCLLRGSWIR